MITQFEVSSQNTVLCDWRFLLPYRFREDITTADAAFEAWGESIDELFIESANATMNIMVENPGSISPSRFTTIHGEADTIEMLLFRFLEELIFYKDAEQLLLRVYDVEIEECNSGFKFEADVYGEEINPSKHHLNVDIKAVTLHRFSVEETERGWEATVVVDI